MQMRKKSLVWTLSLVLNRSYGALLSPRRVSRPIPFDIKTCANKFFSTDAMGNKIVSTKKAKKLTSAELRKKKKVCHQAACSQDVFN